MIGRSFSNSEARVSHALIRLFLVIELVSFSIVTRADEPGKPAEVTASPPFEAFLVIPLRVHVLTADDFPEVACKLRDDDVTRILGKVNGIWNKAGIHWGLDALVRRARRATLSVQAGNRDRWAAELGYLSPARSRKVTIGNEFACLLYPSIRRQRRMAG